jgi:hypothetical protein
MELMLEQIAEMIVPIAIAAVILGFIYFAHVEGVRRMELLHRERLEAMERGIPLPELPSQLPTHLPVRPPPNPKAALLTGILMTTISLGCMLVLFLTLPYDVHSLWVTPAPVAFAGVGIILYYYLRDQKFD